MNLNLRKKIFTLVGGKQNMILHCRDKTARDYICIRGVDKKRGRTEKWAYPLMRMNKQNPNE